MSKAVRAYTKLLGTNQEARTVRMVCSTTTKDRHGDTIKQDGWKLDNFRNNPVILWGHDKYCPPIGKALDIGITPKGLEANIQFATAEEHELADTVYKLLLGGYLNAGSVGFYPLKYSFNDNGGIDFEEQELFEFSIVTVPSNPDALCTARSKGLDLSPLAGFVAAAPRNEFTELRQALGVAATKPAPSQSIKIRSEWAARQIKMAQL